MISIWTTSLDRKCTLRVQPFFLVKKILFNNYNNLVFIVRMNLLRDAHMRITTDE